MLIHSYLRKLDIKNGTLCVPAEMRRAFDGQLVLTSINDGEVSLYSESQFALIEQSINSLPVFDPTVRRLRRSLIGQATDSEIDQRNRFLMPHEFREFFKATKQIAILCIGNQARLISSDRWIEVQKNPQSDQASQLLNSISLPRFLHPRHETEVEKPLVALVEEK